MTDIHKQQEGAHLAESTEHRKLNGGDTGVWSGHLREQDLAKSYHDDLHAAHLREHELMSEAHRELHHALERQLNESARTANKNIDERAATLNTTMEKNTTDHWRNHQDQHQQSEVALAKIEKYADERSKETSLRFETALQSVISTNAQRDKSVDDSIKRFEEYIARNEGRGVGQAPFVAIGLSIVTAVLSAGAVIIATRALP